MKPISKEDKPKIKAFEYEFIEEKTSRMKKQNTNPFQPQFLTKLGFNHGNRRLSDSARNARTLSN